MKSLSRIVVNGFASILFAFAAVSPTQAELPYTPLFQWTPPTAFESGAVLDPLTDLAEYRLYCLPEIGTQTIIQLQPPYEWGSAARSVPAGRLRVLHDRGRDRGQGGRRKWGIPTRPDSPLNRTSRHPSSFSRSDSDDYNAALRFKLRVFVPAIVLGLGIWAVIGIVVFRLWK